MISLTRLSGKAFLLNADLIERVDCTPDTVVTLVDGTKYVVAEPLAVVLDHVISYRAAIVARAALPESSHVVPLHQDHAPFDGQDSQAHPAHLSAVPDGGTR